MTLCAVVPVKDLLGTKSRLTPVLNPCGRAGLTMFMAKNVLTALKSAGVERTYVISPDPVVLAMVEEDGAVPLLQESQGLNPALEEAREKALKDGATTLLIFPSDLPLLRATDVGAIFEAVEETEGPLAVISPDVTRTGTNALLLRPPDALPFLFGPNSFEAHRAAAEERGLSMEVRERPRLAFDLDTAEDLARLGPLSASYPGAHARARNGASDEVRVLPMRGLPEVRTGDDLSALVAGAAKETNLLREGDVVVVTHKVVSKAEGRLVDLKDVRPSALARDFAARYDKDPRQVEVVLKESKRIVRMDHGIIISETSHGFVCANAGVDASNVPGGDTVCLLPEDPDASARRLREDLTSKLDVEDLAIVVSDSFGRPWRTGITNVAIGVAGMSPFADYRGGEDPHGNPLSASILAVADELAAAAELVMGKTSGVPVAVVRDYPYDKGPGSGGDLVMPPERDLFR